MNSNQSGKQLIGIGGALVLLLLLMGGGGMSLSGILRLVLQIGFVIVLLLLLLVAVIFGFAMKASHDDAKDTSGNRTSQRTGGGDLTGEQNEILVQAKRELGQIKILLTRIRDSGIRSAGEEICRWTDKILTVLREDPKNINDARQFLRFHLTSVENILVNYSRLEQNGVAETAVRDKVQAHLTEFLTAAKKQHEILFADENLNLKVDMEALRLSCIRDGLLEDEPVSKETAETDIQLSL